MAFYPHAMDTLVFLLTKSDKEGSHCLVLRHVYQPSAQTEMWEYQQHLLHDVIDVGDILQGKHTQNTRCNLMPGDKF